MDYIYYIKQSQLLLPDMKKHVTLSQSKYSYDEQQRRINANQLKIRAIDQLQPMIAKAIKILWMPFNQISCLDNIGQFINLQQLNIKGNKIKKGAQILKLEHLYKFQKLWLDNNPFLLDPLEEPVLEFIIQKQTDIEILSSDTLQMMQQLHNGELKKIFLTNYLSKINYHKQIANANKDQYKSNSSNEQLIINNILPQMYSTIEDPQIKRMLKREALLTKKETKLSFDQVISMKKQKQTNQVNNLIEDILMLVEEPHYSICDERNNDRISERVNDKPSYLVNYKNSQKMNNDATSKKNDENFNLGKATMKKNSNFESNASKSSNLSFLQEFKNKTMAASKYYKFIDREESSSKENYFSFSKTTPLKHTTLQQCAVSAQDRIQETSNIEIQAKTYPHKSERKNFKSINEQISLSYIQPYENYETLYYQNLSKFDPIFTLLFSDYSSLEAEEKNILIEALQKDHRDKTINLYKLTDKFNHYQQQLGKNTERLQAQTLSLTNRLKQSEQYLNLQQKCLSQAERQNQRLIEIIRGLTQDYEKAIQCSYNHQKSSQRAKNKIMELQGEIAQFSLKQEAAEREDKIMQIIQFNKYSRIKQEVAKNLSFKARQMYRIKKWKADQEENRNNILLENSWNALKNYFCRQVLIKMKKSERQEKWLAKSFKCWALFTQFGKNLKTKENQVGSHLHKKSLNKFFKSFRAHYYNKKEGNLKKYWADQYFTKIIMVRFMKKCEILKNKESEKIVMASQHNKKRIMVKYINQMKKNIATNNKKYQIISQINKVSKTCNFFSKLKMMKINNIFKSQQKYFFENLTRIAKLLLLKKFKKQFISSLKAQKIINSQKIHFWRKKNTILQFRQAIILRKTINTTLDQNIHLLKKSNALQKKRSVFLRLHKLLKNKSLRHKKFRKILTNITKKMILKELQIDKKQFQYEKAYDNGRIRQTFHIMFRYIHLQKLRKCKQEHKAELVHTQMIINKIKSISMSQMESVRQQYEDQRLQLQEEVCNSEAKYREFSLRFEEQLRQKSYQLELVENQRLGLEQKLEIYRSEKQIILAELDLQKQKQEDNYQKVERLKTENLNLANKYDRILQLYTKTTFEMDRKQRQYDRETKDKTRQKTVQKKPSKKQFDYLNK